MQAHDQFQIEECSEEVLQEHVVSIHLGQPERFTLPCCFRSKSGDKIHVLLVRGGETIAVGSAARDGSGARMITSRLDRPRPSAVELAQMIERLGGVGELVLEEALLETAREATSILSGARLEVHFELTLYRYEGDTPDAQLLDSDLRIATRSDVPLLADLIRAFSEETGYEHPDEKPDFTKIAQRNVDSCLVQILELDGMPVAIGQRARKSTGGQNRIGLIYVLPEHRRKGHARRLVRALAHSVLSEGAVPCLFADSTNPVSKQLYIGLSFTETESLVHLRPEDS